MRVLKSVADAPLDLIEAAERLRRFKNQLVHGIEVPDAEFINAQTLELRSVVERTRQLIAPKSGPASKRTTKKSSHRRNEEGP
ncbi:hypothetical protein [Aquincola tertiaricarbonis]|uniref:hypothetical protein n=1 Tax=Aquincola tertiaricarbonis TaxID=391953 RepID=UPI0012EDAB97|nr:hypothetical protein [Aquincola tertiaricarbonis]